MPPPGLQVESGKPSAATPSSCVILGQKSCGKTQFLGAASRACHYRSEHQPVLDFIPDENMSDFIRRSARVMRGEERHPGTFALKSASFDIREYRPGERERGRAPRHSAHFDVFDTPGEWGVQTDDRVANRSNSQQIWARTQMADSIILCVDLGKDSSAIDLNVGSIIANSKTPRQINYRLTYRQQLRNFVQRIEPEPSEENRLSCRRFLLLLTKADQPASQAVDRLCAAGGPLADCKGFTALRLAQLMDPVTQALQLLGGDTLGTINNALMPGASFAVGICSAGGFDIDGSPYLNTDGVPLKAPDLTGSDLYRRWVPFGVREAISFAAFGTLSAVVHRVTPAHLGQQPGQLMRIASVAA